MPFRVGDLFFLPRPAPALATRGLSRFSVPDFFLSQRVAKRFTLSRSKRSCPSMSAPVDPIGAAQRQLVVFCKALADALYFVQQGAPSPAPPLAAAAAELERLCAAIPDYAAIVGPREGLCARLCAAEASAAALGEALATAVQRGEAAAAKAAEALQIGAVAAAAGALTVEGGKAGGGAAGAAAQSAWPELRGLRRGGRGKGELLTMIINKRFQRVFNMLRLSGRQS